MLQVQRPSIKPRKSKRLGFWTWTCFMWTKHRIPTQQLECNFTFYWNFHPPLKIWSDFLVLCCRCKIREYYHDKKKSVSNVDPNTDTGMADRPGALHLEKIISPSEFSGKEKIPSCGKHILMAYGIILPQWQTTQSSICTPKSLCMEQQPWGENSTYKWLPQCGLITSAKGLWTFTLIYVIMLHHVFLESSNMLLNFSYCWLHCRWKQITWAQRSWQ